jgi:hypothetical protein
MLKVEHDADLGCHLILGIKLSVRAQESQYHLFKRNQRQ